MAMKLSYNEYMKFYSSILKKSRYGFERRTRLFLDYLIDSSIDKTTTLPLGKQLFRTQRGHDEIEKDFQLIVLPYKKDRMIPKSDKVKNGRVNPIGIPVLYLSDDQLTAIAETRPWLQETISLATFMTVKDLKILDISNIEKSSDFYLKDPKDEAKVNEKIWADVSNAFSRPVTIDDQDVAYIPTQVIGEYFKINGYDGICYKSLLGDGKNYALFDINNVEIKNGVVMEVKKVKIEVEQYGNPVEYNENNRVYNIIDFIEPIDK